MGCRNGKQEPIGLVGRMKNLQDGLMRRRTIGLVGRSENQINGIRSREKLQDISSPLEYTGLPINGDLGLFKHHEQKIKFAFLLSI